ncbi:MAG TPA: hypothetical protein VF384_06915 [Planctomycetota bacterium]
MRHTIPVRGAVDAERIALRGDWRGCVSMAADAGAYVAGFGWCKGVRRACLGLAIPPVFGAFLCELSCPEPGGDRWLWTVVGDLPSAYFVLDRAKTPSKALAVYCELMAAWVDAVRAGKLGRAVFPVRAEPTLEHAGMLASRLEFLRDRVLSAEGLKGVMTGAAASRRRLAAQPRDRALRPGMLVVDNHDRDGIVVASRPCPDAEWLAAQRDRRVLRHRQAAWWTIFPLSGGSVYAPSRLMRLVGRPTRMQHAIAWRNANEHARKKLRQLLGPAPY